MAAFVVGAVLAFAGGLAPFLARGRTGRTERPVAEVIPIAESPLVEAAEAA